MGETGNIFTWSKENRCRMKADAFLLSDTEPVPALAGNS